MAELRNTLTVNQREFDEFRTMQAVCQWSFVH